MGMEQFPHQPGSIYFTFFGVPTIIRPSSWLVLAILGSGFGSHELDIAAMLTFVVAGMLCLLSHEYGHAFVGRACGSGDSVVEIASMGGVTMTGYPPRTRLGNILMTLAGPGASLLLAAVAAIVMSLQLGVQPLKCIVFALTEPLPWSMPMDLNIWLLPIYQSIMSGAMSEFALLSYLTLFSVCVWWSIFNLLPVFPLDGGRVLYLLTNNTRLTSMVGVTVSALLCVWCLTSGRIFTLFICACLLWVNWQQLRLSR